jgi:hypothetical protein
MGRTSIALSGTLGAPLLERIHLRLMLLDTVNLATPAERSHTSVWARVTAAGEAISIAIDNAVCHGISRTAGLYAGSNRKCWLDACRQFCCREARPVLTIARVDRGIRGKFRYAHGIPFASLFRSLDQATTYCEGRKPSKETAYELASAIRPASQVFAQIRISPKPKSLRDNSSATF